jgi:hypothetical protein
LPQKPTEHFDVVKVIEPVRTIELAEYDILRPDGLVRYNDWYVFTENREGNQVKFLNVDSKKVIEGVGVGQGPLEVYGYSIVSFIGDSLCMFGFNQKKILVLDVVDDSMKITLRNSNRLMRPDCFIDNERYIESGWEDSCICRVFNLKGEKLSVLSYPQGVSLSDYEYLYQNSIYKNTIYVVSPDKTKYAFGLRFVQMMGFGSIVSDSLTLDKLYEYAPISVYDLIPGESPQIAPTRDNTKNVNSAFATEDYVGFVYFGSRYDDNANFGRSILLYKWDGTPYIRLDVDDNLLLASYDKDRNVLMCLSYVPEAKLVEYDMTGIIDVD